MKLSVITVTYNASELLEKTIQSIIGQQFKDFEYLIIDGGSTDKTLEIVNNYQKHLSYWISEKDKGIYDAMNKGIKAARGEYLMFINAGDELHNPMVLQKIFSNSPDADILYGETLLIDKEKELGTRSELSSRKLPKNLTWKSLSKGMVVCHQSFIVRKSIAPFYNLNYKYSADIDWVISCLKNSKKTIYTNIIISKYLTGGYSIKNLKKSLSERFQILLNHFGLFKTILNHLLIFLRFFVTKRNRKY